MKFKKSWHLKLFLNGIFFLLVTIVGCVSTSRHGSLKNASLPELIPREDFFNTKQFCDDYQISPDGRQLAWIARKDGIITIFQKTIGQEKTNVVDTKSWCNVSWFCWEKDSRHLLFSLAVGPNQANCIYRSDIRQPDAKPSNLTPDAISRAYLEEGNAMISENILLSQNAREEDCFDLYRVNLKSGDAELLAQSDEDIVRWITDRKGNLKGCIRAYYNNERSVQQYLPGTKSWKTIETWDEKEDIRFLGFTPDEKEIWLLSNRGRDRLSLVRFNLETGKETLVLEDPVADIEDVYISCKTGKALFAYAYPDYPKVYVLDTGLQKHVDQFKQDFPAGIEILAMDETEQLWTVKVFDEKTARFYLYDLKKQKKKLVGKSRPSFLSEWIPKMEPISFKSRDNLTLRGYLTRPIGVDQKYAPMVLFVHGGPWARDYWGQDRMVQFFANRGYAVLQINFRGSTGYGRAFMEAAIHEFGKKMHTDLIDAVNWVVAQQIADPENIAIVGGSYGGYAAMAGATFTPDVFSCAVSINGVSDLVDAVESWPTSPPLYKKRGYSAWYKYVGNPKNVADMKDMKHRSPLLYADRVKKPIFIIYGKKDRRVWPRHSEKMINELKKFQKQVSYTEIETEGHGIRMSKNSIQMYQEIERFLAKHIGGRYQK